MRIAYFGTGVFAIPALEALADHIVLAVSQPDRPTGRGMRLQASPVKLRAIELGIPVETPEKARSPEFVELLEDANADALLVASYGQILSQRVLDSAARGGINLHGSILPKYRGAAPIQRAIQSGDTETGVTLMQMDKGMDSGDIIHIARCPIGPDETYGELQARLAHLAAELAADWMPRIVAGNYSRTPQVAAEMTLAPKIDRTEGELDIAAAAEHEYAKFRAFTPSPGAYMKTRFGILKIVGARLGTNQGPAGVVLSVTDGCEIAFGSGSLNLLEVQLEGKKKMSGRDFANGMRLKAGRDSI